LESEAGISYDLPDSIDITFPQNGDADVAVSDLTLTRITVDAMEAILFVVIQPIFSCPDYSVPTPIQHEEVCMKMRTKLIVLSLICTFGAGSTQADGSKWEIGGRLDGNLSDGQPANDLIGGSVLLRYRLNNDWLVGGALEFSAYDFERPYGLLNLTSTKVLDASVDSTMLSIWAERRYNEPVTGGYWFWTAGAGINNADAVPVTGTTATGGTYNIKTNVDTEFVLFGSAGRRHNITDHFSFDYGVRVAGHFGDWISTDSVSGIKKAVISDYFVHGVFLTANYRF